MATLFVREMWTIVCVHRGNVQVYKPEVATATEGLFIPRKLFTSIEDNSNKFTFPPHPLCLVETDVSRHSRIQCMISPHFHLEREQTRWDSQREIKPVMLDVHAAQGETASHVGAR